MKANKVLEKLEITRRTLSNYIKSGKIRIRRLDNGFCDYDDSDVERLEREFVTHNNRIIVYLNGNKFEYNLSEDKINTIHKILEVI